MKPFVLLRAASIVALLLGIGHMLGMPWLPVKNPETLAIVQSMTTHRFDVMGALRSLQDFYVGFGIVTGLFTFALALLIWMVAAQARTDAPRMRPFITVFALTFAINTVIAGMYFFVVPCAMSAIVTICLAAAWLTAKSPA